MEKYSHWRDSGTGIQPFLPLKSPKSNSVVDDILYYLNTFILGPPIAIFRLLCISVIFILFLIQNAILKIIPISSIKWLLGRIIFTSEIRLVLFHLGFIWIDSQKVTLTRGRKHAKKEDTCIDSEIINDKEICYLCKEGLYLNKEGECIENEKEIKETMKEERCEYGNERGCLRCNKGYYKEGKECKECSEGCIECYDKDKCIECSSGIQIDYKCIETNEILEHCKYNIPNSKQ